LPAAKEIKDTLQSVKIIEGCYTDVFIADSLLILIANCDSNFFHVYDKNTLRLLNKFGYKGNAPHEFIRLMNYNTTTLDDRNLLIQFFDIHSGHNKTVDFERIMKGESVAGCVKEEPVDENLLFCHSVNFLGNNKVAMISVDESEGLFMIYDQKTKNKSWVDYHPKMKMEEKLRLSAYYGIVNANPDKEKIVYASRFIDEILFFNMEGKLQNAWYLSDIKKPDKAAKFMGISNDANVYALRTYSTPQHIYVSRVCQSMKQLVKEPKNPVQIIAFDWDGNLTDVYEPSIFPYLFCVDEATKKLYIIRKNDAENDPTSEIFKFSL
jgi:hypothetical protein